MAGKSKYTPEVVTTALMALVTTANPREASAALKDQGIDVPHGTLSNWRSDTHAARYAELAKKYGTELEKHAVHNALVIQQAATDVQMLAIQRSKEALESRRDSSPSQTALNMGKVITGAQDTHAKLTGRPTAVIEFRNADDALDSLLKKLGVVDTTATDITEANQG